MGDVHHEGDATMSSPADRKYTATHEWAKLEGSLVIVGITKHAVEELADITYLDLPEVGTAVKAGAKFGEIESVKAVSELVAPVSGTVAEVNAAVAENAAAIGDDPWDAGWMIRIAPSDPAELDALMDAAAYDASLEE
jgi:glycine cleavage system H protein